MMALMSVAPEPLPLFVIVPMLLTEVVDNVMPLAIELLLLMTRLPVPVTPPDPVSSDEPLALLFVSVVPPLFTVSAPLTVSADVVLFSVIPVTFEPTAALMSVVPLPAPILVMVPALLTAAVESVIVPVVALLLIVRLLVPVTPPLKVVEIALPLLPMVSVPVVPLASTIGRAMVNPVVPTNSVALALPLVLPSVIVPAPKALALVVPGPGRQSAGRGVHAVQAQLRRGAVLDHPGHFGADDRADERGARATATVRDRPDVVDRGRRQRDAVGNRAIVVDDQVARAGHTARHRQQRRAAGVAIRQRGTTAVHRQRSAHRQRRRRAVLRNPRDIRANRSADERGATARTDIGNGPSIVDGSCRERDRAGSGVAIDRQIVSAGHATAEGRRDSAAAVADGQRPRGPTRQH